MVTTTTNNHKLILIQSESELNEILIDHKSISLNVETTGFDYVNDYLVGVSVGVKRNDDSIASYYIPLRHKNYSSLICLEDTMAFIQNIIDNERVLFFNRPFAFAFLEKEGVKCDLNKTHDVQIMLYLATSKSCPSRNEYAGLFIPNVDIFDLDFSKQNFSEYNPENAFVFAAQKSILNILLGEYVWQHYPMIHNIYTIDNRSNEVVRWLCKTTQMPINYDYVKQEYERIKSEIENVKYQCKSILGYEVNIDSPQDRLETLKRFLPIQGDADSFKDYQLDDFNHPIAKLFKRYGEMNTYKNMLESLLASDGQPLRVRYSTITAKTGRLTSGFSKGNSYYSDFNIQNVEKREVMRYVHEGGDIGFYIDDNPEGSIKQVKCKGGLRDAFVCPEGYVWVSCDYSGEEMCLLANFSKDDNLIKPIRDGKDIHNYIAKSIFGYENPECRTKTKALNFSVVYGAGENSIAKRLGISTDECKRLLEKYYTLLFRVRFWRDKMIAKARKQGYVSTLFGRPRMLYNEYMSSNRADHSAADRAACNSPIQGCTPLNGHLETEDAAIRMSTILGTKQISADKRELIPTHRGDSEPLFCLFKSGDYLICDNNHQLIYNNMVEPKVTSIRKGFQRVRVMLAPLRKKSLKFSKFLFKPLTDCKAYFILTCKRDNVIKRDNKDMNSALFRLALRGCWFSASYESAISMRSVASVFGYNVVYSAKRDMFKVRFWRRRRSAIRNIWWCFDDDKKVPMGTCTTMTGFQMYMNQGFWNKNTGADIIRLVLCKFKGLFDNDKEWADNVKFACTIHDECNFYVKKEYLGEACKKIYETMYFTHPLCVLPVEGKLSVGTDWGHLMDIELNQIKNNTIKI